LGIRQRARSEREEKLLEDLLAKFQAEGILAYGLDGTTKRPIAVDSSGKLRVVTT